MPKVMVACKTFATEGESIFATLYAMSRPVYIVVTPFFPSPGNWRGSYCYDFVQAVISTGRYEVRVFVPGSGAAYEYKGIRVATFTVRSLPSAVLPLLYAWRNSRSFLDAVEREGIRLSDIAVCHGHTAWFAVYPLAIKQRNSNCITLLHHHDPASFGLGLGILGRCWLHNVFLFPMFRKLHEAIDCHVFISEQVRKSFLASPDASWTVYKKYRRVMRGLGFYRPPRIRRSLILHNGVDVETFSPGGERHSGVVIGSIGNFIAWKDQLTLCRAFEIVKKNVGNGVDLKLRMIGSGPMLPKCNAFIEAHGLSNSVSFETEVDHVKLPEFYRSIDLFVLPSYFEGFGCVFTEAYACGVPFITCEGQGMDDLVPEEERSLWLCKPMDADDLARKIEYYLLNRPTQHLVGEIAIKPLVEDFLNSLQEYKC